VLEKEIIRPDKRNRLRVQVAKLLSTQQTKSADQNNEPQPSNNDFSTFRNMGLVNAARNEVQIGDAIAKHPSYSIASMFKDKSSTVWIKFTWPMPHWVSIARRSA